MSPLRIVVIDDNVHAAETLGVILRSWGYEVRVTHDGESGLAAVAEFQPALVLVDIRMPEMDGFAVVRQIRTSAGAAGPAVWSLTGEDLDGDGAQPGGRLEFDHHLRKPLNLDALERRLARETARAEGSVRAES